MNPFENPQGSFESRLSRFRAELERQEREWTLLHKELEQHRGTELWVESLPTIKTETPAPIFGVRA